MKFEISKAYDFVGINYEPGCPNCKINVLNVYEHYKYRTKVFICNECGHSYHVYTHDQTKYKGTPKGFFIDDWDY